ncbi:MAG TPA: glycosyltransferase, partial [archaeon]|nr:glycosyltransferase [archaeon]
MRVCIITLDNTYPKLGGTSELLHNFSTGLIELGFEVHMASFVNRYQEELIPNLKQYFYHNYAARLGEKRGQPHINTLREALKTLKINGNVLRANTDIRFYEFLKSILIKHRIDALVVGTCWPAAVSEFAAKSRGISSVLYLNAIESDPRHGLNASNRVLARTLEKVGIDLAFRVTVASNDDKEILLKRGISGEKLALLPNCVDCRKYEKVTIADKKHVREILGVEKNPVVVFVGGLDYPPNRLAVKRIYQVIVPTVLNEMPHTKFCIIGP